MSEKVLQLIEVITPPVINHLSGYGTVCYHPFFFAQRQKNEHPGSYKQVLPKKQEVERNSGVTY